MPRTKVVKKKDLEVGANRDKELIEFVTSVRAKINADKAELESKTTEFLNKLEIHLEKSKLSIPPILLQKTIGELMDNPPDWSGTSIMSTTHNLTKTMTAKRPLRRSKSSSFADEGYLTTESSKSTSGSRQCRTRKRDPKTTRISRSNSRQSKAETLNKYKTPRNKAPPATYGTVTPKVKPNTPQILLRRPKQGEVAWSLQGSPLLTSAVVTDEVANVNIPLNDGGILTIQPRIGLRLSQIPNLDEVTKHQLEVLRDNLNKVCALSGLKK